MFEDEIGGVRIIIESHWGRRLNEDMTMRSALSFEAPGGHIFYVVAQGLKKYVWIGTTHEFVDLKVSNWPKHTQSNEKQFLTFLI